MTFFLDTGQGDRKKSRKSEAFVLPIDSVIEALKLAKQAGFSSKDSPIEPLLQTAADVCLAIRSAFQIEKRFESRKNPQVKFDYGKVDSLGNPKSFKVFKTKKFFQKDPDVDRFMFNMAKFFILLKDQVLIRKAFAASFQTFFPRDDKKTLKKQNKNAAKAAFYRRRKRKNEYSK